MGDEGSRRVVERVAEVIDRIGEAQQDVESTGPDEETGPDRSDTATAVTDGGADEAPQGSSPWIDDDPITFGEDAEEDPGTAILEAVTDDEPASPFDADDEDSSDEDAGDDGSRSEERFEELEARIGVLESDHAQLASQLTDVEDAIANLGADVDRVGADVRELVTLLGGVALATDRVDDSGVDPAAVAEELAPELEEVAAAAAAEAIENAGVGHAAADAANSEAAHPQADADTDDVPDVPQDDPELDPDAAPEGIHRGVGDVPGETTSDPSSTVGEGTVADDEAVAEESRSDPQATEATERRASGEPSRELVDPRSDAVGARLRQFKERFVDDPTADLPAGSSADEFRFEKVLLPTDGEHAPDLSTDELEKPYLEALPDGYAADAVVLEWLDWLVSAADGETAARAIAYYASIDWLTEDARDALLGYLDGLGEPGAVDGSATVSEPPAALDLQDHLRSLQYVTELATGEVDADGF